MTKENLVQRVNRPAAIRSAAGTPANEAAKHAKGKDKCLWVNYYGTTKRRDGSCYLITKGVVCSLYVGFAYVLAVLVRNTSADLQLARDRCGGGLCFFAWNSLYWQRLPSVQPMSNACFVSY